MSEAVFHTTEKDLEIIYWLFDEAIAYQKKKNHNVWKGYDKNVLNNDIQQKLQYKICEDDEILGIFSIFLSDPLIWRGRDKNDAVYLHRIVVNPYHKGKNLFGKVLAWTKDFAKDNHLKYIRLDTWGDNETIIDYYKSFGFSFVEHYTTPDIPELAVQHRSLYLVLLQLEIHY